MTGQELRDKNKGAFKLKGMPHIYWINLDADEDRREYMENQFEYWEIENHTRIEGIDAREDDPAVYLKGIIPNDVTTNELGCCLSHLKAIKHFYENTDDEYCLILEDDANLDLAHYWNFTCLLYTSPSPRD